MEAFYVPHCLAPPPPGKNLFISTKVRSSPSISFNFCYFALKSPWTLAPPPLLSVKICYSRFTGFHHLTPESRVPRAISYRAKSFQNLHISKKHPSRDVIDSGQNLAKQSFKTSTFGITRCEDFWPDLLEVSEGFHIRSPMLAARHTPPEMLWLFCCCEVSAQAAPLQT